MADNKRELKLSSSKDWDAWLTVIRAKATGYQIWGLIDPAKTERPSLDEPTEPDLDSMSGDKIELRYKIAYTKYKREYQVWQKQTEGLAKIISHIFDTTSITNITYIQDIEVHPWIVLRALKARLAPTDDARSFELEQQYNRLVKGPIARQSVEAWLDEYLKMYTLGKQVKIAEVVDSKRAYRDFLQAIEKTAPTFAEVHQLLLDGVNATIDYDAQILQTIEKFRHHVRLKEAKKGKGGASHSAFATDEGKTSDESKALEGGKPSFRGNKQQLPPCYCGYKHYFHQCWYLNEAKRPSNWTPDPDIQKKVDTAMKDPDKRAKVDRNLAHNVKWLDDRKAKEEANATTNTGTYAAAVGNNASLGAFSNDIPRTYSLHSSWILDSGSSIHIANEAMKHRFTKERDCTDGSTILAGNGYLPIIAYGQMVLNVAVPAGKGIMTLTNVLYVPGFMTNVVSGSILEDKGLHFDTAHRHLHRQGKPIILAPRVGSHYILEDNTKSEGVGAFAATKSKVSRTGSTYEWHQLLAHANNEAIQHLPTAAEGVELSNSDSIPKTNKCETCALAKAHNIISRSPDKSETSDKPFYRITYDLIDMSTAMNKDKWISHIACSTTGFQLIYSHATKGQAASILMKAINTIETRYGAKVVFVRSDGEKALGKQWDDYCDAKGITFEPSAPDTPAQNGHSERLGNILLIKSRAMRIEANLPTYLWPWISHTAGYIMNRTPTRKLHWKTPYEMVTGHKPNLAHLVMYGAKAYPTDKHISKREKMKAKAHIGFLVGYDSTNIFLIWIPSQRKVIRTRDVKFNEDSHYRPHEIDAAQLISEPFLNNDTLAIPDSDFVRTADIESDSDEDVFELAPTGTIAIDDSDEENIPKEDTEEGNTQGYLPSPTPSALRGETTSDTDSPFHTPTSTRDISPSRQLNELEQTTPTPRAPQAPLTRHYQYSMFDPDNVLPEGSKRVRKPRKEAYYAKIADIAGGGMQSFYGTFAASMVKEKRSHRDNLPPEPKYYHQMLKHPESPGFLRAMEVEIKQLQAKQTWKEVPYKDAKAAARVPIPTTWVYKYKFDNEGYLIKHKARLCARGDLQQTNQDVYAATLAIRIFRALMAIVTAFNLDTRQYDAVNAFANSDIDEPTYCKPPDGWKGPYILLLLLRALYGLKQSPMLWYKHLSATLVKLGLEQIPEVECLFTNDYMIVFFFVDDIAVLYHPHYRKQVDEFEKQLFATYEMRNMGEIEWFLGIRITRDRELQRMSLCQDSYIDKLISKFNIDMSKPAPRTPLCHYRPMTKYEGVATPQEIHAYQQRVGSISFSAITTRPDVAQPSSKLSEFLTNPSPYHMEQANQTLHYLGGTKTYAIVFDGQAANPDTIFLGSSDASFADDIDTRRSSSGYCFKLFNGMIDWKATKQKTVTTSSTEAELLAMSMAANTKMWWDRFLEAIQMDVGGRTHIECDNRQTIRAFTHPTAQLTTKLRHVDIHRHWLRQEVQKGTITIQWTPTNSILADGLTKALPPQKHQKFVKLMGLEPIELSGKPMNDKPNNEVIEAINASNGASNNT